MGIIRNTLSNITALNENVLSTMLGKCLGIETLQQQMLGQAVLNRLLFKDYFTLPDDEGRPCFLSLLQDQTLILSYVLLQYGGGYYFSVSVNETMKVKNLSHAATPGAKGWMSIQHCSLVYSSISHMFSACSDTTHEQTGGRHIYASVRAHS